MSEIEPYTRERRKEMAVEAFRKVVTDRLFISQSCGDMRVERNTFKGICLSQFAAEALLEYMDGKGKYVVMRRAVLMEDAGAETCVQVFGSRPLAAAWIEKQKGQYFGPGDYYIAETRS